MKVKCINFLSFIHLADDSIFQLEDFIQEVEIMKKLGNHYHVVNMFGSNVTQEPYFIIVEYAQHGDLKEYLKDKKKRV